MSWVAAAIGAAGVVAGVAGTVSANKNADKAIDAQQAQNRDNQEFIERQASNTRRDAVPLYDSAQYNRDASGNAALGVVGDSMRQQIDTTARGNYFAQEALLAGLPQIQNAILGMPIDGAALQPTILHPERNLEGMFNTQLPQFASSGQVLQAANSPQLTPGGTTNQQAAQSAYNQGLISDYDYSQLMKSFSADPNMAGQTNWSSAGSAEKLQGQLPTGKKNLSDGYRSTLNNLFNALYPQQPVDIAALLAGNSGGAG